MEHNKIYGQITMAIGDWSSDGHGKSTDVIFDVNKTQRELQDGYRLSVEKTGISFDHGEHSRGKLQLFTEYDQGTLKASEAQRLIDLGYPADKFDYEEDEDYDDVYIDGPEQLADMIMWFIGLSVEGLEYTQIKPKKTYLNGYWGDLNVQFGYGLFD